MGSIPALYIKIKRNIYLNVYFHFFALVSRQSAALRSATQHAMPPVFGKKWGTECHTLGSLCLPCRVRDMTWSWFIYLIKTVMLIFCASLACFIFSFPYLKMKNLLNDHFVVRLSRLFIPISGGGIKVKLILNIIDHSRFDHSKIQSSMKSETLS